MSECLDLKTVVKHLANGSLTDHLCIVCLLPLAEDNFDNIFTSICTKDEEYCIADVLREVCQLKIDETEYYNICCDCFQSASVVYKFYLKAKHSNEILNFYTDQLLSNIDNLEITDEDSKQALCIPLPIFTPKTSRFDYSFDSIDTRKLEDDIKTKENDSLNIDKLNDDEVVVIVEDGKTLLYRSHNGVLHEIEESENGSDDENLLMIVNERTRKKRDPMMSISCLHCPVKYRFFSKLKDHEKKMHNADIYYCKICKLITDKKNDYEEHLSTHIGKYQCTDCNAVYARKVSLVEHMKSHDQINCGKQNMLENGNICEVCGVILENESALDEHRAVRHVNKYTCYYCGRNYKGQMSFESHIEKHEKHLKKLKNQLPKKQETKSNSETIPKENEDCSTSKRAVCGSCGKTFVDERSLLWHQRLHNNDRPFVCNICGRGFVSVNRRNQHATCAHCKPARRCPLCPALFHLRSMVNTHVKKVHLNKQNKRRNRMVKHRNVFWRTETVPIQELSVSIQNEVMEIQRTQDNEWIDNGKQSLEYNTKMHPTQSQTNKHHYTRIVEKMPTDLSSEILMQSDQDFEFIKSNDYTSLQLHI